MRIWHLNLTRADLRVDGIATAVRRLARAQEEAGADVEIFPRAGPAAVGSIRDRLAPGRQRPDVVHFHSVFRPLHALAAARVAGAGIPYVVSPHSGYAPESLSRRRLLKGPYARVVERPFLDRAAAAFCLTEVERDDLCRFSPTFSGMAVVAPNPLDGVIDAPSWTPPAGRPTVVTLCRYDVRQKGLDRLAELARHCPDLDFVVHGEQDKNEQSLTERLRRSAPPNFSFRPPVFGPDKREVLAGATMFALLSRWEGLSMSLAEALAAGVPCAVSQYVGRTLPGLGEGIGLVLDDDVTVAAGQVRSAVRDDLRLAAWSRAGAAYAATAFRPRQVAEQTLAGYRVLATGPSHPARTSS